MEDLSGHTLSHNYLSFLSQSSIIRNWCNLFSVYLVTRCFFSCPKQTPKSRSIMQEEC